MHSNDLDDVLQDLEKQVQDLSLALDESGNEVYYVGGHQTAGGGQRHEQQLRSNKVVSPPSQHSTIMTDDDVALSQLQHHAITTPGRAYYKPATTTAHDSSTTPIPTPTRSSHSASINKLTRSASSGSSLRGHERQQQQQQELLPPLPTVDNDEADLVAAVQCAWAVLEGKGVDENKNRQQQTSPSPPSSMSTTTTRQQYPNDAMTPKRTRPAGPAYTISIYINDLSTHKAVQLTNLLTTAMVVQYFKRKGLLDQSDDWALFEVANSHGVERPLRDWEIVLDTVSMWDGDMHNMLMLKKYPYRSSLTAESVLQPLYPPKHGWLLVETRKGKWQKRFCFIHDNAVQYAKDSKGTGAIVLCHLSNFDVYTLTQPIRGAPTKYMFGLRAQDKARNYEQPEDYLCFLCAEDSESFKEFVLGIRCAKSTMQYQSNPQRVLHPLTPPPPPPMEEKSNSETTMTMTSSNSDDQPLSRGNTIRRYKSMRDIKSKDSNGNSSSGKLSRSGTLRHRDFHDDEDDQGNNSTLIQIDDKVKFAKGSLLEQREAAGATTSGLSRSKSTRERGEDSVSNGEHHHQHRRYHSVRRREARPTTRTDIPAVPAVPNAVVGNKTLLQLEGTPEQIHTRQLRERQMKPLLNFDESATTASSSRR